MFEGSGDPPAENFHIFELSRLDFLQFQHDFRSFSDKKGTLTRGSKPFSGWGWVGDGGGNTGAGGALALSLTSSIYVKRGPGGGRGGRGRGGASSCVKKHSYILNYDSKPQVSQRLLKTIVSPIEHARRRSNNERKGGGGGGFS